MQQLNLNMEGICKISEQRWPSLEAHILGCKQDLVALELKICVFNNKKYNQQSVI